MRITLVGEVHGCGSNGPVNGMYALQRGLRKAVKERGINWLDFSDELRPGSIPWIWSWAQRGMGAEFARKGKGFILGPNVLFIDSRRPRCDEMEACLLDAATCRGIFCHSAWYRKLLIDNMGPSNRAPVWCWPYPIDPVPEPPLFPAQWDVLIFVKSGRKAVRISQMIAWYFKRTRLLHYGEFRREDLFAAARRSRACLYLSDDESGGLVTQEIMLTGCPVVGIERGAPLVLHGKTGWRVSSWEEELLVPALVECLKLDRSQVRRSAAAEFDRESIVNQVLGYLDRARRGGDA